MVNLFYGLTSSATDDAVIEKLKVDRQNFKSANFIYISPDKFSLNLEKQIFEKLNIVATCNINVCTINKLARLVIGNRPVLEKTTASMIIQKILLKNKGKFKCFKNAIYDINFAGQIYETINQLKSCKIKPEDLTYNNDEYLKNKMHDIQLIYSDYEKENSALDACDRMELLISQIKNSEVLKQSHIYISHFNRFTLQGYQVLQELFCTCASVNMGIVESDNLINGHIYLNDVKENVLSILRTKNLQPSIFNIPSCLSAQMEHLQNNLFSFVPRQIKLNSPSQIEIWELDNLEQELVKCATIIKSKIVFENLRYYNFTVALPNLTQNKALVKKVFNEFEFSYYIDNATLLSDSVLASFVNKALDIAGQNFKKVDVLSFCKNRPCNYDADQLNCFENYINQFNLEGQTDFQSAQFDNASELYKNFDIIRQDFLNKFLPFKKLLSSAKTIKNFTDAIEVLFLNFDVNQALKNISQTLQNEFNLKTSKEFSQFYDKFCEVLKNLNQVYSSEHFNCSDFCTLLNTGLENKTVTTIPMQIDSIFVGDISASMFSRNNVIFILGAQEGVIPQVSSDCGLITDKEIEILTNNYLIEPSIKTINLRERFKVFELLLGATQKLFISYSLFGGVAKSGFVSAIQNMFLFKAQNQYLPLTVNKQNFNQLDFLQNAATNKYALKYLIEAIKLYSEGQTLSPDVEKQYALLLEYFNQQKNNVVAKFPNTFNFDNSTHIIKNNVFFLKNTSSVSQIESFMSCPFRHFLSYGLKLKQNPNGSLDQLNVGNILHKVAQVFSTENILPIDDKLIAGISSKIFDNVMLTEDYQGLVNSRKNKILLINLKKEAARFCDAINHQSKFSNFKIINSEARFSKASNISGLKININKKTIVLNGAIDRIDVLNDYFRVIDYKTGNCDIDLKNLYYGKRIQLYIYTEVAKQHLNLKPAGAYYFPVKSAFATSKILPLSMYKLKGYTVNDDAVINGSDTNLINLNTSNIIDVKKNVARGGKVEYSKTSKLVDSQTFLAFCNYALKLLNQACKDILTLNISPLPLCNEKNICDTCVFSGICRFDLNYQNKQRKQKFAVEPKTFLDLEKVLENDMKVNDEQDAFLEVNKDE